MKQRAKRMTASFLLIFFISSLYGGTIQATQNKIDEVQNKINELEEKKNEAQKRADNLSESANGLQGDLKELDTSLSKVTAELNETEDKLANTRKRLKQTKKDLRKAQKREAEQYEAMKKRIQFMYELDTDSMMEMMMEAGSIADFLNRGEYIVSIHEYDRNMLELYRATKEEIVTKKQKLEAEKTELAVLQEKENAKKQELTLLLDETSQKLASAKAQLKQAKADTENYKAKIAEQKAYEEKLEAQKAAEDAKRLEEIRRQEEEMKQNAENKTPIQADASEQALLAAIIQCEAGGESYEGKLAVGSVVINRVRSSHFPNNIAGVIYQKGQFSPVASGRFAAVLAGGANKSCVKAAAEVLGGNITVNCLYFRRNNGTIDGLVIGNHVFY